MKISASNRSYLQNALVLLAVCAALMIWGFLDVRRRARHRIWVSLAYPTLLLTLLAGLLLFTASGAV